MAAVKRQKKKDGKFLIIKNKYMLSTERGVWVERENILSPISERGVFIIFKCCLLLQYLARVSDAMKPGDEV